MATPAGFEPATCPLGGGCSIQLSHGAASPVLSVSQASDKCRGFGNQKNALARAR